MTPVVPAIASLIIPGLGQIMSGRVLRGVMIFVSLIVVITVLFVTLVGIVLIFFIEPIIHFAAAYEADKLAS